MPALKEVLERGRIPQFLVAANFAGRSLSGKFTALVNHRSTNGKDLKCLEFVDQFGAKSLIVCFSINWLDENLDREILNVPVELTSNGAAWGARFK